MDKFLDHIGRIRHAQIVSNLWFYRSISLSVCLVCLSVCQLKFYHVNQVDFFVLIHAMHYATLRLLGLNLPHYGALSRMWLLFFPLLGFSRDFFSSL